MRRRREHGDKGVGLRRAVLVAGGAAGALAALAGALCLARRPRRQRGDLYFEPHTMFGPARVFEVAGDDGAPVRVLSVAGTYQSATYLGKRYTEPVFAYYRAFDCVFEARPPVRNVLMVGGGGYAWPKHAVATHPEVRLDVVEVDPAITRIAERYFYLDRLVEEYGLQGSGRLGLVTADGRAYLDAYAADASRPRYDAVVLDSFGAGAHVPALMDEGAARSIHACLRPGGVLVANVVAAPTGPTARILHGYTDALARVFAYVEVRPVPRGDGALGAGAAPDMPAGAPGAGRDFKPAPDAESGPDVEPDNLIVLASDGGNPRSR